MMITRSLHGLVFGVAALGLAAIAQAQQPAPPPPVLAPPRPPILIPPPPAPADMPARLAAADKLVSIMHLDKQLDSVMPQMLELFMGTLIRGNTGNEAQIRQILTEELGLAFKDVQPSMMQLFRQVYARNLTIPEMEAMTAFYSTEIGQSVLAKTPALTQDSMLGSVPLGQKAAQAALPRVIQRMQAAKLQVPKGT